VKETPSERAVSHPEKGGLYRLEATGMQLSTLSKEKPATFRNQAGATPCKFCWTESHAEIPEFGEANLIAQTRISLLTGGK